MGIELDVDAEVMGVSTCRRVLKLCKPPACVLRATMPDISVQ